MNKISKIKYTYQKLLNTLLNDAKSKLRTI